MARRKSARGALAVHHHFALAAVHLVAFELGDVVAHVVNDAQFLLLAENPLERLAGKVGNSLAIGPGKIRRGAHGRKISLPFGRLHRHAGQLAIRQVNAVAMHGRTHFAQVIRAHLVAQPA